jgi:repressor of nif and glnA expression
MTALKETAQGTFASARKVSMALERRGHRLSEDSVKRHLKTLESEGVVEFVFDTEANKMTWRMKK